MGCNKKEELHLNETDNRKGVKRKFAESDNRMSRLIFKLAVELAMTMNIIASSQDIDKMTLTKLRGECVKEVKRLNGSFSFDDAYDWQKG